jgi:C-terminal processing protease CtpA/Prc
MKLLSHADALILDMRNNSGGSPGTVAFLMSYLLDEPGAVLFEILHRAPEPADRYATESTPLPERDPLRPVHVLTSPRTFSAGEGLAFLLQERRRAEVVGETTAGAANPGKPYPVNDRFSVTVPNGRVRSAIGGGNWEGTGVAPDVTTTAAEALQVAYARAIRRLIAHEPPGPKREALRQLLANPQVKE